MASVANTPEGISRPTKKPRLDGADTLSGGTTRSDAFWLNDGNIILQAQDGKQFRVHKGTLSMNSIFFRDMFATVADAHESLTDGCPVVQTQDATEDWETVLGLFYSPMTVHPDNRSISLQKLMSMLRLGRKYQFDSIVKQAMERLEYEFPTDIDEFDKLYHFHMQQVRENIICRCRGTMCQPKALIEIINFAVEWGITRILPTAYYLACVHLTFDEILEGTIELKRTTLCDTAQKIILRGRERIKTDLFETWYPWLTQPFNEEPIIPSDACADTHICEETRRVSLDAQFMFSVGSARGQLHAFALDKLPLDYIITEEAAEAHDLRHNLCPACQIALLKHYNECRRFMFAKLPNYFRTGM